MSLALLDVLPAAAVPLAGWAAHVRLLQRRLTSARRDPVSGLLARAGWTVRAERLIRRPDATVLLLDLDRFKPVNDRYGHQAGDAVLRATAARLADWCGPHGVAGRLGGDEFAAVVQARPSDLPARLAELRELLHRPVPWPGGPLVVGASVGTARPGELTEPTLAAALREADQAMYQAKGRTRRGRGRLRALLGGAR